MKMKIKKIGFRLKLFGICKADPILKFNYFFKFVKKFKGTFGRYFRYFMVT